ncbi:hypothetical protein GQ43DRAFT_470778 [Delitschia confertaspora ATCC 74209]|uniref:Polyketide synthase n=1 Tax=Delitschia confertaspora ATCC 74209 TaxID=1513339 RepID=A0A9P4MWV1_9PLEO|nr:hypothetical protein GQ43DRAFT_470778 [Delitschia confertaspora ATCC 74209]
MAHATRDRGWQEPIAIVGFAARLPGARSATEFWDLLKDGRSAQSKVPAERFNIDAFYHPDTDRADSSNFCHGHFLSGDIGCFDAPFFSIQPNEAISMDPQQRLVLETSYHALESAGMPMESVAGSRMAVYIGTSSRDYESILTRDPEAPSKYIGTGIGTSLIANRVSWFFDLKGPSLAIDTGCSGSLVGLHTACQAIQHGDTDTALVGGVSLILSPDASLVHLSNMGFFSPDGYCFSFDERANGYSKGEGVAVIVLKRLSDAICDGNTIRAIIRSTSCNQDGHTPGLTVPSLNAQIENIQTAYRIARLDPASTAFFEAHGTGTQVGDTVEAEAIYRTFQRPQNNPLYVGALKSNIGHLEAASGIAGLVKSTLALEKGIIPPNLNFRNANPKIDMKTWGLAFPTQPMPWPKDGQRRISLNSFGYGGTNAHVVLDDAASYLKIHQLEGHHNTLVKRPDLQQEPDGSTSDLLCNLEPTSSSRSKTSSSSPSSSTFNSRLGFVSSTSSNPSDTNTFDTGADCNIDVPAREARLLVFSAADETSLKMMIEQHQTYFASLTKKEIGCSDEYLDNLSYTLATKRSRLPWKAFAVIHNMWPLRQLLESKMSAPIRSSRPSELMMVFSGQGAQYAEMGQELLCYTTYRSSIRKADRILLSLGTELSKSKNETRINEPLYSQPSCTALQLALFDLLSSWDITPSAVVGHSSGEIAAAYAMGSLSFEGAVRVSYFRGVVASKLESDSSFKGAMSSIALSREAVTPILEMLNSETGSTRIQIGCVNSNKNVTVTGETRAIESINQQMKSEGTFARSLAVTVPYHSVFMQAVAKEYRELLHGFECGNNAKPSVSARMFSSVTGREVFPDELSKPQYWVQNMVSTVLFLEAMSEMLSTFMGSYKGQPHQIVEVGPHSVLQRPIKDIFTHLKAEKHFGYESVLIGGEPATDTIINTSGRLYCKNAPIDVSKVRYHPTKRSSCRQLLDLPLYPFNHSTSHWYESRMSRMYRFKKYPRHDFLGNQVLDWNRMNPRWRNIVRLSEHPWLQDYVVSGRIAYPPSGLLVMALETLRQLRDYEDDDIGSFELMGVSFAKALIIPDTGEVEIQISLRPKDRTYTFSIYSFEDDGTSLICEGTVLTHVGDVVSGSERVSQLQIFEDRAKSCNERVDALVYYTRLSEMGYSYGPEFKKYSFVKFTDAGLATSPVQIRRSREDFPDTVSNSYIIHPVDLEVICQLSFAAASSGSTVKKPYLSTKKFGRLLISNTPQSFSGDRVVRVQAEMLSHGNFDATFSVIALNDIGMPVLRLENLNQSAETSFATVEEDSLAQRLVYQIAWKPDPALASDRQIRQIMEESVASSKTVAFEEEDLQELIAYHYVGLALESLSHGEVERMPLHLKKYMAWAKHIFNEEKYKRLLGLFPDFANPLTREEFEKVQGKYSSAVEFHVETGKMLLPILRGEVDALDLLFKSGLVERYYANDMFATNYQKLAAYIDLLALKNPQLAILEVGAGTGGATKPIMKVLSSDNPETRIWRFKEYMYTDVSPVFFERAKDMFRSHVCLMKFEVLDIEKDVLSQGFGAKYDVVICSGVLHISAEMEAVLRNVRQLLKPGGKLVQFEPSNPETCRAGFTFGLLKDWWVSKEVHRHYSPLISDEQWDKTLIASGFSGADVCIPSFPEKEHQTHSIFISTRTEPKDKPMNEDDVSLPLTLVVNEHNQTQLEVARALELCIGHRFTSCATSTFSQLCTNGTSESAWYIFLAELEEPFLRHIKDTDWKVLKCIMDTAKHIIWVTRGGGQRPSNPDMSIVTGFGRSMITEKLGLDFMELALEANSTVSHISERVQQVINQRHTPSSEIREPEYSEENGFLNISRLVPADSINKKLHSQLVLHKPVEGRLSSKANSQRRLSLAIAKPGDFESVYFGDPPNSGRPLGDNEVVVRVVSATLSTTDVDIALARRSGTEFGFECAGVITQIGPTSEFQLHDRVCACLPGGALATSIQLTTSAVAKIPNSMSFELAATLPVSLVTVYHSIINIANLNKGERVLIAIKEWSMREVAIQIAMELGAIVLVAAMDEDDKLEMVQVHGLSVERVIVLSPSISWSLSQKSRARVDVVLFSTPNGEHKAQLFGCLAPFGRFIDIDGSGLPFPPANITYSAIDIVQLMASIKGRGLLSHSTRSIPRILNKPRSGMPLQSFKASELSEAFTYVRDHGAKAIINFYPSDVIKVVPTRTLSYAFDPNVTYVIAGGNGGLGRAIAVWLADCGAKNILILGRSGATGEAAQLLLKNLRAKGINIHAPPCDLSNADTVQRVLKEINQVMPPVKGVIQATMVLREGILINLTASDWHTTLAPKVQGTWNLHTYLPRDLDFFVCLSSMAGITGCRSQAPYNAACTYQDALVRYRHSLGERAMSFDLGVIIGSGFAAATDKTEMLKREGYLGMPKKQFLAILDYCCNPNTRISSPQQTQLVSGLDYMKRYKAGSKEGEIYWARNANMAVLRQMNAATNSSTDNSQDETHPGELLAMAKSQSQAIEVALHALIGKLSKLFSIPTKNIDPGMPIYSIGIDSLVALEIRYWLMKELKADLAVADVLKDQALIDLARCAVERSGRMEGKLDQRST